MYDFRWQVWDCVLPAAADLVWLDRSMTMISGRTVCAQPRAPVLRHLFVAFLSEASSITQLHSQVNMNVLSGALEVEPVGGKGGDHGHTGTCTLQPGSTATPVIRLACPALAGYAVQNPAAQFNILLPWLQYVFSQKKLRANHKQDDQNQSQTIITQQHISKLNFVF